MKLRQFIGALFFSSLILYGCSKTPPSNDLLKCLAGNPEYKIQFISADLTPDGKPKEEVINGVKRLVFHELTAAEEHTYAPVINRIKSSEVIKKALELRWNAREYKAILSGGKLAVEDAASDPFYVVLHWNTNTLEAKADKSVIYSRDGGTKFSSVSLIVTGLGPVPFEKFIRIPFISDTIIMHELMHCMQIEATGSEQFTANMMRATSMQTIAHKVHLLTDPDRSFVEGFAESFERIGGRLVNVDFQKIYDDFVAAGPSDLNQEQFDFLKDKIMTEELHRQLWIRDNYFGGFDDLNSTSSMFHYPRDLLNSEGVVATVLYNFMTNAKIASVYPKLVTTIIKHQPADLVEFFESFGKEFPDDRNEAFEVYIQQTLGVTRNANTYDMFRTWRKLEDATSRSEEALQAKQLYTDAIDTETMLIQYEPVLNSLLNRPLRINTKDLGKHYPPFWINLNQESELVLTMIFKDMVDHYESIKLPQLVADFKGKEQAQTNAIIARREALHNLSSIEDLNGVVTPSLMQILRSNVMP